jgi:apolipoprotein N-acyltransferase
MPEAASLQQPLCPSPPVLPDIIAWPEAPSPFRNIDPRFQQLMKSLTGISHAPVIAGNFAIDFNPHGDPSYYNSASFVAPDGRFVGRYNKMHLVPWGEYVPFKEFFSFAGHLTHNVGDMTHGYRRDLFSTGGHKFGVFICYESIFGDEIRLFAKEGADVFVNISDDGWYGDTSAPWQHLNMARMRAIENRRWLLRDTNTGVTTVIDPYGRLTASAPRHVFTSLGARYGYREDKTFYTLYGNVFAWLCGIITLLALMFAGLTSFRHRTA